jgi:hypothetical protein
LALINTIFSGDRFMDTEMDAWWQENKARLASEHEEWLASLTPEELLDLQRFNQSVLSQLFTSKSLVDQKP